jgi:hypothetical protein
MRGRGPLHPSLIDANDCIARAVAGLKFPESSQMEIAHTSFVRADSANARRRGTTATSGHLDPHAIQLVIKADWEHRRNCYTQGLARNPDPRGRVTPRFVIEADGSVSTVVYPILFEPE